MLTQHELWITNADQPWPPTCACHFVAPPVVGMNCFGSSSLSLKSFRSIFLASYRAWCSDRRGALPRHRPLPSIPNRVPMCLPQRPLRHGRAMPEQPGAELPSIRPDEERQRCIIRVSWAGNNLGPNVLVTRTIPHIWYDVQTGRSRTPADLLVTVPFFPAADPHWHGGFIACCPSDTGGQRWLQRCQGFRLVLLFPMSDIHEP
jgi:hypothetical protein